MPGLMTTFVNVGLNDELVEAFAARPETSWAAWDGYRRFLQSWAMSYGIDRDFFDAIMTEFKARYGVEQKLDFTSEQMREIAFAYKSRARDHGVVFVDDPFAQVVACMRKVLESWDSAPARVYRQYLGVSEEWGTAVVVQRMVFGNLSRESGSGVTFTNNPLEPHSRQVRLFGDFAVRSQGEDLVGGLVFPWPISEAQRQGSLTYRGTEHSLERDFPDIYQQLLTVARDLVGEREFDPQEIEFTFESPAAPDLYILQKRSAVQEQTRDAAYFDTTSPNYGPPVAVGMGVAGGAYSGRVAVNAEQIDRAGGGGARREHRPPPPGHRARRHRHDHPGQRHPHRARRHHVARRRDRQAPGQDGGRRVRGPRGVREDGHGPAGGQGAGRRRLGVHRRPDGQYLLRAHPHDGAAAAPARPLRAGGQQPEARSRGAHGGVAQK